MYRYTCRIPLYEIHREFFQIDFLQQANHTLEDKLSTSEAACRRIEGECSELHVKNASICAELQSISELVGQMEKEKASELADAAEKLSAQEVSCACVCVCVCVRAHACVLVCVCKHHVCTV